MTAKIVLEDLQYDIICTFIFSIQTSFKNIFVNAVGTKYVQYR